MYSDGLQIIWGFFAGYIILGGSILVIAGSSGCPIDVLLWLVNVYIYGGIYLMGVGVWLTCILLGTVLINWFAPRLLQEPVRD